MACGRPDGASCLGQGWPLERLQAPHGTSDRPFTRRTTASAPFTTRGTPRLLGLLLSVLAFRQQVLILQRQLGKRPRLSQAERLAMLLLCVRAKPRLLDCLVTLGPATPIRWHGQIVRR